MAAKKSKSIPAKKAPDATAFSLEGYMADPHTRVFNYNGKKLLAILGRENFPGERVFKLPTKAIEFASRQPLTSALLPGRVGYFPHAAGQKVSRPNGDWAFTLLFCLDGAGLLELANSRHRIERGMFVLLRPFEFHSYSADPKQPWSYYWLHFHGTMAQQYYEVLTGGGRNIAIATEPDMTFVQNFEKILNLLQEGHAHRNLVQASAAMHQLLGDLYRLAYSQGGQQDTVDMRIDRSLEAMRNNLNLHISIHELAAAANMSHSYFVLQFRRRTGENPRSYFNRLKLEKACEYLRSTTAKVDSIAHLLGYEDPFYFCRLFKRVIGQTPTGYRRSGAAALGGKP